MENFTPVASLIGGILIGLSASAMLFFNGKIAGISGIVAGLLSPTRSDIVWRATFVAGLLTGGFLLKLVSPEAFAINIARSGVTFALAGLLIGFGARLGNGCTSGHGVCGISRFSKRSVAATATFIATGAAVVYVVNHLLGGAL
jgi:uncharacterized membrane protein YedE/YeeE